LGYALQQSFAVSGYGGPPVLVTPTPEKSVENPEAKEKDTKIIPLHKEPMAVESRLGTYLAATVSIGAMSGAMRAANDNKAYYKELYQRIEKNLRDKQNQKAELQAQKTEEPVQEDEPELPFELSVASDASEDDVLIAKRQHDLDVAAVEKKNSQAEDAYHELEEKRVAELSDVERTIVELETTLSYLREKEFNPQDAKEFLAFSAKESARDFAAQSADAAQPALNFVAMQALSEQIGPMLSSQDLQRQQFHANAMAMTSATPHTETAPQLDAQTQQQLHTIAVSSQFNASIVKGAVDMLEEPVAAGVASAGGPQEPTNEDKALDLIKDAKAEQDEEQQRKLHDSVFVKDYAVEVMTRGGQKMRIAHRAHHINLGQKLQGSDADDLNAREQKFDTLRDQVQLDHIETLKEQGEHIQRKNSAAFKVFIVNREGIGAERVPSVAPAGVTESLQTKAGLFKQSLSAITGQEGVDVGMTIPFQPRHFEFEAA
jgi:hypothetical protein